MLFRLGSLRMGATSLALWSCLGTVHADPPVTAKAMLVDEDVEYFERRIRPLLSRHCYECHSTKAKTVHGGLQLDHVAGLLAGGDSGRVIQPGNPDESLLISSVRHEDGLEMPPKGKLSDREQAFLVEWVRRGAPFPSSATDLHRARESSTSPGKHRVESNRERIDYDSARQHWAFQTALRQNTPAPLQSASDGATSDSSLSRWPRTIVDAFVLERMMEQGLAPSEAADRATLLRRLSFDLVGIPPTPEQVRSFVADPAPDAYRRRVDALLASPLYGERWARWWLDLARYTDRTASWLYQTGQSHLFRDWVVTALNEDMPYDEFIHRQLATDLMPETGPEDLPALGFLALSPSYWKELKLPCDIIKVIVADEWEERVDAVSRSFLGLTVACARCHDHKFDPISSDDYYAMAGVFASCRQIERPLISEQKYEPVRKAKERVRQIKDEIAKLKKSKPLPQQAISAKMEEMQAIEDTTPDFHTPMANALSEEAMFVVPAGKHPQDGSRLEFRSQPRDLPRFIRGNPNRPGPVIPRRFLRVLSEEPTPFQNGSGRLELAQSITGDGASLAARVLVNRIWLAHFGRGIVATPSNFGQQGSRPTHPRLLDDLAARFIEDGWSIKKLHREILLSATWRQSSLASSKAEQTDPENRWLSHVSRRRLDFEQWRDAMFAASGDLDPRIGGRSEKLDGKTNRRRTIYATVHRRDMSSTLLAHDFPDPTQHSPQRGMTVTALQGLYALNGPLLESRSFALADRLLRKTPSRNDRPENGRVELAYWSLYGRAPTERETMLAIQFLNRERQTLPRDRWQQYLHVLLASNEFAFLD